MWTNSIHHVKVVFMTHIPTLTTNQHAYRLPTYIYLVILIISLLPYLPTYPPTYTYLFTLFNYILIPTYILIYLSPTYLNTQPTLPYFKVPYRTLPTYLVLFNHILDVVWIKKIIIYIFQIFFQKFILAFIKYINFIE